jgi:hypothetical protein
MPARTLAVDRPSNGRFLDEVLVARKKVCIDPQIALLVRRYLMLQDNATAKKALGTSRKRVDSWRYNKDAAVPDNPTAIYQPKWLDKEKRGTYPHGFDKSGDLVLIEWMFSSLITIRKDADHLEACFINVFGTRHKAQVVRHIYQDDTGEPQRVLNLYYGGGYDRKFDYKDGRLETIITRYWEHSDISAAIPRIESERTEVEPITYTKAGKVKGKVRSKS